MLTGRNWVSGLLLAATIACLGVGVFPQWHEWVDSSTGERVFERRLGLWFSPVHQTTWRESPQGGFTWRAGINWLSLSSLLIVLGVVCLETYRQRRLVSGGR